MADINLSSVRLPPAFQECEYIDSHGNEYIDLNFIAQEGYGFDLDFFITEYQDQHGIFGSGPSGYGGNQGWGLCQFTWTGKQGICCIHPSTSVFADLASELLSGRHTISARGSKFFLDGILHYTGGSFYPQVRTAALFANNTIYEVYPLSKKSKMRVWGCNCLDEIENYIRRLVPCYLRTNWNGIPAGTIGMYDLCGSLSSNGTPFYTNEGTGTFAKGPDVVHADAITINGAEVDKLTDATGIFWEKNRFYGSIKAKYDNAKYELHVHTQPTDYSFDPDYFVCMVDSGDELVKSISTGQVEGILHIYNKRSDGSFVNADFWNMFANRTVSTAGRYYFWCIPKSNAANATLYDNTNGRYLFKGDAVV